MLKKRKNKANAEAQSTQRFGKRMGQSEWGAMFKRQGSTVLLACQALLFVGTRFESICIVLSNGNGALSGRKNRSKMKSYYRFS
jgi:hypothetical protein